MRAAAAVVTAVVVLVGEQLAAQPSALPVGARVRLIEAGTRSWVVGTLERPASRDSIWVASPAGARALAIGQVDAFQVSRGKQRPLYLSIAPVWTTPAGALAGAMMGLMFAVGSPNHPVETFLWGTGAGAAAGAVTGVVLARSRIEEVWNPVLLTPAPLAAEEGVLRVTQLKPGTRLRVRFAGGGFVDGTVIEQQGDSAVLATRGVTTRVDLGAASALTVDRGRNRALGARVGALWGIAGGAAVGLATIGSSNDRNEYSDPDCDPEWESCARASDLETVYWSAVAGAAIGAAAGAIIGKREWARISLPQRRTSSTHLKVAPRGRRLAVGLSAAF